MNIATKLSFKGSSSRFLTSGWIKFWKNVFNDYREVAKDVRNDVRAKPVKAFCMLTGAAFLGCCYVSNPNEIDFRSDCIE